MQINNETFTQLANCKLIDFFARSLDLGVQLDYRHARWFRGVVGRLMERPEFHQHSQGGTLYSHPLIRYDTSTGKAVISGMAEGAYLVRAMPGIEQLRLENEQYDVLSSSDSIVRCPIGTTTEPVNYRFTSPYLALNQHNHSGWKTQSPTDRAETLSRIIVGNILSFCKAISVTVSERIRAETELTPAGHFTLKPGIQLYGFQGTFRVNFLLPTCWGLGKSTSRGFGTFLKVDA